MQLRPGHIATYCHQDRIGVLVQFYCPDSFATRTPEFRDVARGIAMHIAAVAPIAVVPSGLDPEVRNRELRESPAASFSIEDIKRQNALIDQRFVLMSQRYIRDPDRTVEQVLKELSDQLGVVIKVDRFERFEVSEA